MLEERTLFLQTFLRRRLILLQGSLTSWKDNDHPSDYTEELKDCLTNWIDAEIDTTLWEQATVAHANTIIAHYNIFQHLNDSTTPPQETLALAKDDYAKIGTYLSM